MIADFLCRLMQKKEVAPKIWFLRFAVPATQKLEFLPGQYLLLRVGEAYRQYSIASSKHHHDYFDLYIEYFPGGLASEYFMKLNIGETAQFKGPAGIFVYRDTPLDKVFLATGTGIAPIKSMIESALESGVKQSLILYFGVRTRGDLYLAREFNALSAKYTNFDYMICFSQEEASFDDSHIGVGRIPVVLEPKVETYKECEFYVCGGPKAVVGLRQYLEEKHIPKERVIFEKFA